MPAAKTASPRRAGEETGIASAPAVVRGWAGGEGCSVSIVRPNSAEAVRAAVDPRGSSGSAGWPAAGAIARGMGRAYGDAAQLAGGVVLETTGLKGFALDAQHGTVAAEAGVTLGELLAELVPRGWIVPVLPGTQHVTVGGAIAGDIHGKNHGTAGTFGTYVRALELLTASGEVVELEPGSEDRLFEATIGGMGLTGVILSARIGLKHVNGPLLSVDTDRVERLEDALASLSAPGGSYRVAWLDLLGSRPGRGVVTRAEHLDSSGDSRGGRGRARSGGRGRAPGAARATVPERWPGGLLRPSTVRAFNELRFRRAPRRERGRVEALGTHMFPLDVLAAWPRLYGPSGFVQYQFVVPAGQEHVLEAVIELLRGARVPCFLAVLKDLGPANDAPLSFPIAGWTITLDLPRAAAELEPALQRCDELVAEAGGRVYFSKDALMRPAAVRAMYPRLGEWRAARDRADPRGLWRSDLALRTGLVD